MGVMVIVPIMGSEGDQDKGISKHNTLYMMIPWALETAEGDRFYLLSFSTWNSP